MQPGQNQPIWLTVRVPESAPAGVYRGEVLLTLDQAEVRMPIALEVFGFTLPLRTHTQTAFGMTGFEDWHAAQTLEQKREITHLYLDVLARYRLSPYNPFLHHEPAPQLSLDAQGRIASISLDFSAFDEQSRRARDKWRFNGYNFLPAGWSPSAFAVDRGDVGVEPALAGADAADRGMGRVVADPRSAV